MPTAYNDLESLLTNSEHQLQRSYKNLPPFLQKLIEQLPSKMTTSIAPEMLAAAAEKQGLHSKYTDQAAHAAGKMGLKVKVPSLKDLVTKPGAVAGMLRAIMNVLKLRFTAFLGMNVLYSLALFRTLSRILTSPLPSFPSMSLLKHTNTPVVETLHSPALCLLVLPQTWPRSSP